MSAVEKPVIDSGLPTVSEVREAFAVLRADWSGRNGEYSRARRICRGEHWNADNPAERGRYSLVVNYVSPLIEGAVRDLFGRMPGIQVMPRTVEEPDRRLAEALEAALYQTWADNDAPIVFRRLAHNAVLLRRGILYNWWDPSRKIVRFKSCAPENFYPVMDGDDVAESIYVSRVSTRLLKRRYPSLADRIASDAGGEWESADGRPSAVSDGITDALGDGGGSRRTMVGGGQTTVYDWVDSTGGWVRVMSEARIASKLLIGRSPFITFEDAIAGDEGEPRARVEDIFELNQYLDRILSQHADIIHKYANPTVIDRGSGVDPAVAKRTIQGDGGYLPIRKDGEIGYLVWNGTPPDISAQYERVREAIMDIGGRNEAAYGRSMTNQSGVMTNMSMSPTVGAAAERMAVFGHGLARENEIILAFLEKNMAGDEIVARALRPRGPAMMSMMSIAGRFFGRDIGGWYHNRIKWPAVLRTDDPMYVQTELSKMVATPVPAQSVYTTMENLGIEDVEAELDRLQKQLEDPRMHPERLKSAIEAATALSGARLGPDMAGMGGVPGGGGPPPGLGSAAMAAGNPNAAALAG